MVCSNTITGIFLICLDRQTDHHYDCIMIPRTHEKKQFSIWNIIMTDKRILILDDNDGHKLMIYQRSDNPFYGNIVVTYQYCMIELFYDIRRKIVLYFQTIFDVASMSMEQRA